MQVYTSDVLRMTDADIQLLMKEIEDAGLLSSDSWDYEEGSWERQALDRYDEMRGEERRRWESANPEEAARQRESSRFTTQLFAAQIEVVRPRLMEMFECSERISKLFR
jgi:hypothetical protein